MTILDNLDRLDLKAEQVQNYIISLRQALAPVSTPQHCDDDVLCGPFPEPMCGEVDRRLDAAVDRLESFCRQLDELRERLEIGDATTKERAEAKHAMAAAARSDF